MDTYHWDVLVTYHWDVVGCFIWDLFETSRRRTDGTSLLRPLETSLRRSNKMSWRCTTQTSRQRFTETSFCFIWDVTVTLLELTKRRRYDVATTSCCRLGWRFLFYCRHSRLLWIYHQKTWNFAWKSASSNLPK